VKRVSVPLLACHGGLKEWGQDPLVLDLGGGGPGRRSCSRWWRSLLRAFPTCRGGKEESCGGPATLQGQHRWHLPAWCYVRFVFELNHADGWLASALFCWHGGMWRYFLQAGGARRRASTKWFVPGGSLVSSSN
jgi:hypothetical protein